MDDEPLMSKVEKLPLPQVVWVPIPVRLRVINKRVIVNLAGGSMDLCAKCSFVLRHSEQRMLCKTCAPRFMDVWDCTYHLEQEACW